MIFYIFELASKEIIKDEEALKVLNYFPFKINTENIKNLRMQSDYLLTKKQRLHKKMEALVDTNAMEEIMKDIVLRISEQIVKEAAAEIASLNLLAKTTSLDIIFKALAQERGPNEPADLFQIFFSLRDVNLQKVLNFFIKT